MRKRGFTLIELLAVIVILAIIAVIATPIITGIIEDSKKESFKRSAEGVVEATKFDISDKLTDKGYEYDIVDGKIPDLDEKITISNSKGLNGVIRYNNDGEVSYAIYNDKWCVIKEGNEVIMSDYVVDECTILVETESQYFSYSLVAGGVAITGYNINGGLDVVIPSKIDGKEVVKISDWAFTITGVIPQTLTSSNYKYEVKKLSYDVTKKYKAIQLVPETTDPKGLGITSVVIPSTVKTIGKCAFAYNQLVKIKFPSTPITINTDSFIGNPIINDSNYKYPSNVTGY